MLSVFNKKAKRGYGPGSYRILIEHPLHQTVHERDIASVSTCRGSPYHDAVNREPATATEG